VSTRWTEADLANHVARNPKALRKNFLSPAPARDEAKPLKYGNKITEVRGIKFRSQKEAQRYEDLLLLEKSGDISELALQVKMPIDLNGRHICNYYADFVYTDLKAHKVIVEDCKGMRTPLYNLKKKLVEAQYGVTILET
jgi:hypothetical protein